MSSSDFIPFALPDIGDAEIEAVTTAMRSGWLTTGRVARAFEEEFVAALEPDRHGPTTYEAIAVNSATSGLHLCLEALGVTHGAEVLVPTWTFTATAEVVRYLGATPVLVDVDPHTLNIDLEAAAAAVTERTVAIMPVHFAGLPVPREELAAFAATHGLKVVEDAAHSHPIDSSGVPIGLGASDAVVFSFYATKTMTTGEGGMVVTSDPNLARRMRMMRLHGISRDVFDRYTSTSPSWHYEVVAPGFKYNLTDLAAAIGRVQLSRSQVMKDKRTAIADRYDAAFAGLPVELPARPHRDDSEHAWHLYVLRLGKDAAITRDEFIASMAEQGVGTSVHFIPLHKHPVWAQLRGPRAKALPVADREFERVVSLPIFSAMSTSQVDRVIAAVLAILGR